ncbi:ribonuclease HII [Vallitalea okinawensis]|uniref:ribonuclease HII n=1 Tax=Vallitalea okinawensis TaxID=2078660 RepID=UPI001A9A6280|nr:ribonuclease HII [Vallitalea okinawensis]
MAQSIKAIDLYLSNVHIDELHEEMRLYYDDERAGVQNLLKKYNNKLAKHQQLIEKFEEMSIYENSFQGQGKEYIAGIDEVGRGPLAGPVVSAVVILDEQPILGLDDSKKLSEVKREAFFEAITQSAVDYRIGIIDVKTIDEINILQATYEAMRSSIDQMSVKPDQLLVDAVTIPDITIPQEAIIKGDSKSISIAAASIVAKVSRDRMMEDYHELFPQYNFKRNKGYGTKEHIEAIKKYGLCPIHRKSFVTNLID